MKKKSILITFILILLSIILGTSNIFAVQYSLIQCIDIAVENNLNIAIVENQLEIARMQIDEQFVDVLDTEYSSSSHQLQLLELESNRMSLIDGITVGVCSAYFSCLIADSSVDISQNNLEMANNKLDRARVQFELGTVNITAIYDAERNVQSNRSDLLEAEYDVIESYHNLQLLMDLPINSNMTLTTPIPSDTFSLNLTQAQNSMQENNLEWIVAGLNERVAHLQYEAMINTSISENQRITLELNAQSMILERENIEHDLTLSLQNAYFATQEAQSRVQDIQETMELLETQINALEMMLENEVIDFFTLEDVRLQYEEMNILLMQARMGYYLAYLQYYIIWRPHELEEMFIQE